MDSRAYKESKYNSTRSKVSLLMLKQALKFIFRQNDASLQSLFDQLDQLDSEILSKRNEINSTKQKIYLNKNMIEKQVKMMLT